MSVVVRDLIKYVVIAVKKESNLSSKEPVITKSEIKTTELEQYRAKCSFLRYYGPNFARVQKAFELSLCLVRNYSLFYSSLPEGKLECRDLHFLIYTLSWGP